MSEVDRVNKDSEPNTNEELNETDAKAIKELRLRVRGLAKSASKEPTQDTVGDMGVFLGKDEIWQIRCHILLTVAIVGSFLLSLSFLTESVHPVRNILLGVGIELLASAGVVFGIVKCLDTQNENVLIRSLLIVGAILSLFPFLKTDCWCGEFISSAGIEILGAAIMLGLYDFLNHKFSVVESRSNRTG